MICWKNTGNKSWSDENHPRRYSDDFPHLISMMYVYVHMYGKAMGAGGPPSERAKATSAGWHWRCHPRLPQPLQTPRRERMLLLSLALIFQLEKELLVSAQVSVLFWRPTTWKMATFIFPLKGNPDTVQPKIELL